MKANETLITGYCQESNKEMKARLKLNAELGLKGKISQQKAAPQYQYIAIKGSNNGSNEKKELQEQKVTGPGSSDAMSS
jgi:hypothetical protein